MMIMMMMMTTIMIMSMGWNYISELRPPTSLLFIVHCWNDIDRGKLLIRPPGSLVIIPAESSSSKAGEAGEGNDEFGPMKYLFILRRDINMP
jgi:hypothetical protein